jgi:heme/copper-type cytochrome/quinol oxidase subunit 3
MPSGRTLALVSSGGSLVIAIAYLVQRQYRQALYWFFAACIGITVCY